MANRVKYSLMIVLSVITAPSSVTSAHFTDGRDRQKRAGSDHGSIETT